MTRRRPLTGSATFLFNLETLPGAILRLRMQKNSNQIIIALLILIIGFGVGYTIRGNSVLERDSDGHMMSDGSMMGNAMGDMMTGLQGKTGDDFDKAFLAEMIVHHQGAVTMAEAALQDAKHQELKQMAESIISAQTTEINQMKQWQKSWYNIEE